MQKTLSLTALLLLAGCGCLKGISLAPEMSAIDLKRAQAGSVRVGVRWQFSQCCPTSEQETVALRLQTEVADLFTNLVAGKIELDRYNQLVRAAQDAIKNVILVCAVAARGDPEHLALGSPALVQKAWHDCGVACRRIKAASR